MTQPPPALRSKQGPRSLQERREAYPRALRVGLVLSLAVHVVVVGLVGGWLAPERRDPPAPMGPMVVEPPTGMRVVTLPEIPSPLDGEPDEALRPPAPDPSAQRPAREVAVAADPAELRPADDLTAADRLAPRVVDPRLWRPMILISREPTLEEVEARIAAALELMSDSALAAVDAEIRARDWTVEDANGGKWGISPGKIHLGSVTLPIPLAFPVDPGAAADARDWYQLERALDRTRILESFEDRVRAIRERRDREREEAAGRPANGGG